MRQLPPQEERVETGAVRFGDDWPGYFMRGDNAMFFAIALDRYLKIQAERYARPEEQILHTILKNVATNILEQVPLNKQSKGDKSNEDHISE